MTPWWDDQAGLVRAMNAVLAATGPRSPVREPRRLATAAIAVAELQAGCPHHSLAQIAAICVDVMHAGHAHRTAEADAEDRRLALAYAEGMRQGRPGRWANASDGLAAAAAVAGMRARREEGWDDLK